jgi:hypothetical protein
MEEALACLDTAIDSKPAIPAVKPVSKWTQQSPGAAWSLLLLLLVCFQRLLNYVHHVHLAVERRPAFHLAPAIGWINGEEVVKYCGSQTAT